MNTNTVTNAQIRMLRTEAQMAGDIAMAMTCDIALDVEDAEADEARAVCAKVIADWQAEMAAGRAD